MSTSADILRRECGVKKQMLKISIPIKIFNASMILSLKIDSEGSCSRFIVNTVNNKNNYSSNIHKQSTSRLNCNMKGNFFFSFLEQFYSIYMIWEEKRGRDTSEMNSTHRLAFDPDLEELNVLSFKKLHTFLGIRLRTQVSDLEQQKYRWESITIIIMQCYIVKFLWLMDPFSFVLLLIMIK